MEDVLADARENPFDLVIFGGMGDLSRKKLLPALYAGLVYGRFSTDCRILITSHAKVEVSTKHWLTEVFDHYPPACGIDNSMLDQFANLVEIIQIELSEDNKDWARLAKKLKCDPCRTCVYFLAIPPKFFTSACKLLGQYELNHPQARVVLEKPLGHDLASAQAINAEVGQYFTEEQTFRIDHYLGKEAVQNLLALRFSNVLFEELWHARTVDHIQITIAEQYGVEGRGAFYDGVGAMRDMVQNHLLQLLCLVAMEPPARMDAESIRDEKLKVLKALRPMDGKEIEHNVVHAQYDAGIMRSQAVASYQDDLQLAEPSSTETFVAIKAHIENWRWAGVPFYLRTGKRMKEQFAEIVVQFKAVPHSANPEWDKYVNPNRFIIRLQPEDHLVLRMMVKKHGGDHTDALREVEMNLDSLQEKENRIGPYLRLILDAVRGDQSLFVHRNEVEYAWRWIDSIVNHWQDHQQAIITYPSGTWGPYEAHDLINRDKRQWFRETNSKQR